MVVRSISDAELEQYHELGSETGKVFYSPEWMSVFGTRLRRFGVFSETGQLAAGFHLFEHRRWGVRVVQNPPFTPIAGPFMRVMAQHPVAVLEAKRKVLAAMADFLAGLRRAVVSLSLDHSVQDALPFHWKGFKTIPRYTYLIDLRLSLEQILKNFSDSRRRNVAKAQRDGLKTERITDLRVIRELVRSTFERQQGWLDTAALDAILFQFAKPQNSFAFITRKDDHPIACTLTVHDQSTAYYLMGGYDDNDKHHSAGALAMWESIRTAKELGLRTFDFEGSSIRSIERYLRGFGGRLTHYFTVNRAWLPFEIALKLKKRNAF